MRARPNPSPRVEALPDSPVPMTRDPAVHTAWRLRWDPDVRLARGDAGPDRSFDTPRGGALPRF
jgi:hypothetical protein